MANVGATLVVALTPALSHEGEGVRIPSPLPGEG
jgi:hypothetical protein